MNEIPIDNSYVKLVRNLYQSSNFSRFSERKGFYVIVNNLLKNRSRYPHTKYIKDLSIKIQKNGGYKYNDDSRNPFIKRFLYKKSINNEVESTFKFINLNEKDDLYLLELDFCTKNDIFLSDISNRIIKKMKDEKLRKSIKLYSIDHDNTQTIKFKLKTNTTQKKKGFKI